MRSRNQRSWLITTTHPAKSSTASSSARSVSTSRSFVGSSSRSTLPPERRSFARWTRLRSPPERSPTFFCWSAPRKFKEAAYARALRVREPIWMFSARPGESQVVDEDLVTVSPPGVHGLDDDVPEARSRWDRDLELALAELGVFCEEALVRVDARLAFPLARARRRAAPLELARERSV